MRCRGKCSSFFIYFGCGFRFLDEIAEKYGIPVTAKIPMDPSVAAKCDAGDIEYCEEEWLEPVVDMLCEKLG